jgi:hypothetical protein
MIPRGFSSSPRADSVRTGPLLAGSVTPGHGFRRAMFLQQPSVLPCQRLSKES